MPSSGCWLQPVLRLRPLGTCTCGPLALHGLLLTYIAVAQPVTLNCPVLFPLSDPASVPIVLSTLAQLSASVSPASCDPFIRQEAFKPDVMNADSASLGARVAAGLFANNTASFMQGSTQDICAAAVCHACFCRENMLAAGGGGFGTGLPGESVCTAYSAAFYAQDRLRYIILGISIATMTLLLTVRLPCVTRCMRIFALH